MIAINICMQTYTQSWEINLPFTSLLADEKWVIFFLIFPENRIGYFMNVFSI